MKWFLLFIEILALSYENLHSEQFAQFFLGSEPLTYILTTLSLSLVDQ